MSNIIEELQNATKNNNEVQKYVQLFIKEAKEAAARGACYEIIRAPYWLEDSVAEELKKLGFRRWTKPVYWGDARQEGVFMTWQ